MKINKHILPNGLRLVHYQDLSTQMVALNIVYDVGARDEDPEHTGFAHLFEHLMFGGSVNIPDYDAPLQSAGGENNAWTNNDITNYYLTVPKSNVEIGFWLESDRMLELAFSEQSLEVQRGVVMEEFKQRCLNQPPQYEDPKNEDLCMVNDSLETSNPRRRISRITRTRNLTEEDSLLKFPFLSRETTGRGASPCL